MKSVAFIISVLFLAAILYVINLPPKEITIKDITPSVYPNKSQNDPFLQESTINNNEVEKGNSSSNYPDNFYDNDTGNANGDGSSDLNSYLKNDSKGNGIENSKEILLSDYYIIVESVRNLTQAQNRAEKLQNDFNRNFIVLPPTKEGYCRISCGKYSTLEEARSAIKSIKTKISPDVWILTVKRE